MPWQPLRRCSEAGCNVRVRSGKCEQHKQQASRQQNARRGSRRERGYTAEWDKYRRVFLKANPLCAHCLKAGIYAAATIVDHIIPIDGGSDVLFWPASNHQPLCHSCHSRKTTTTDPLTKTKRKAGAYSEQEAAAIQRHDWIHAHD